MIESPVLQELKAEWTREAALEAARETTRRAIVDVLVARFGAGAEQLSAQIETINDEERFKELVTLAAVCPDLKAFRTRVAPAGV
jgi:hypothetical protein